MGSGSLMGVGGSVCICAYMCVCVHVSCISYLCQQKFALLPERQVKCRSSPHTSDSKKGEEGRGEGMTTV